MWSTMACNSTNCFAENEYEVAGGSVFVVTRSVWGLFCVTNYHGDIITKSEKGRLTRPDFNSKSTKGN